LLLSPVTDRPGFRTRDELIGRYADETGAMSPPGLVSGVCAVEGGRVLRGDLRPLSARRAERIPGRAPCATACRAAGRGFGTPLTRWWSAGIRRRGIGRGERAPTRGVRAAGADVGGGGNPAARAREWRRPPLLLINGIGAYMKMWTALEAGLPDVRLIAFDAPGSGRSPSPMVPLPVGCWRSSPIGCWTAWILTASMCFGYSFGGLIAQFLARQAPARVRRLVLVATTPGWAAFPAPSSSAAQMSWLVRSPLRQYEWMTERLIGGGEGGLNGRAAVAQSAAGFRRFCGTGWRWQPAREPCGGCGTCHSRTLVVTGERDRWCCPRLDRKNSASAGSPRHRTPPPSPWTGAALNARACSTFEFDRVNRKTAIGARKVNAGHRPNRSQRIVALGRRL